MLPDDIFVFFFINGIRVTMCEHLRAASCTAGEAGKGILYKIQIETSEKQKKRSIIFIWSITVTADDTEQRQKMKQSRKQPKKATTNEDDKNGRKNSFFCVWNWNRSIFEWKRSCQVGVYILCVLHTLTHNIRLNYYSSFLCVEDCFGFSSISSSIKLTRCSGLSVVYWHVQRVRFFFFVVVLCCGWAELLHIFPFVTKFTTHLLSLAFKKMIRNKYGCHETWNWTKAAKIIISFC